MTQTLLGMAVGFVLGFNLYAYIDARGGGRR